MSPDTPRDRLNRALAGAPVDRPPVWFMRQAGRCLPEYRKLREDHGFREVCSDPALAREVTLQPVERFGFDAAVVFSDILLPLDRLGFPVRYEEGVGPVLDDPLRDPERVDALPDPQAPAAPEQVDAIEAVRSERPDLGLVGFAGAPFTVACYLIEGRSPKRYEHANRFRREHPDAFAALLERLADVLGDQLAAQARAGADAVQLFDTHAEVLAPRAYAGPPREATRRALDRVDEAATIAFARGSAHLLEPMADLDADALGVDWRVDLDRAAETAPGALQGNLDPGALLGPPEPARERAREIVRRGRAAEGHVFNLGHGVTPGARLDTIEAVVDAVQGGPP